MKGKTGTVRWVGMSLALGIGVAILVRVLSGDKAMASLIGTALIAPLVASPQAAVDFLGWRSILWAVPLAGAAAILAGLTAQSHGWGTLASCALAGGVGGGLQGVLLCLWENARRAG